MSIGARLPGRLQMVFQRESRASPVEPPRAGASPVPLVELTAYADDSVARGRLALTTDRVTDLMNERTEFEFVDTSLQSLDDGHVVTVSTIVVGRDEIYAVAISGPRGDPRRRTRTRPIPIELRVGRYDVNGNIHILPGTDPIVGFRRRRAMVPLTEATIAFDGPAGRTVTQVATLLINRDLTVWLAPASRSEVRPPERAAGIESGRPGRDLDRGIVVR
jgi:hypothetical protein